MYINEDSYLYKMMHKYSPKEKQNELNKRINILLVDFSKIDSIEKLEAFCKKYKTSTHDLSSVDFIINTIDYNRNDDYQVVNIKSLVFLTNNIFMFNFFNEKETNFHLKPMGWYINGNTKNTHDMSYEDLTNLSLYLFMYGEIKPFDNNLKMINYIYTNYPSKDNEYILTSLVVNYLNRSRIETPGIIDCLDLIIKNKIKNDSLNFFIEENIEEYVQNKNTFKKMAQITGINIFQEKILANMLTNSDYFKKCIDHFGYQKTDTLFSQIYNLKELKRKHRYPDFKELPNNNLSEILIKQRVLSSNNIEILYILDEKNLLNNIIKKDTEFFNKLFFDCYYDSKNNDIYKLIDFLEKKYNYHYLFFKTENNKIVIDKFNTSDSFNKKEFINYNINKNSSIPENVFKDLFSQSLYYKDSDLVDSFFRNNRLKDNDELYKILLLKVGDDKRKKSLNSTEGLDFLNYLFSQDFKELYSINIDQKEEIKILKERKPSKKSDMIDLIIEKKIIIDSLSVNNSNYKDIKRRL